MVAHSSLYSVLYPLTNNPFHALIANLWVIDVLATSSLKEVNVQVLKMWKKCGKIGKNVGTLIAL